MNLRTFICKPFISDLTFTKSYHVRIFLDGDLIYQDTNNIWPDGGEKDRINFLNMILDEVCNQPPLTEYEIVIHKLTKDY